MSLYITVTRRQADGHGKVEFDDQHALEAYSAKEAAELHRMATGAAEVLAFPIESGMLFRWAWPAKVREPSVGKGPFLVLVIVATLLGASLGCGDNGGTLVIDRDDAGSPVRGAPINVDHGSLSLGGDRPLVICHGTGCGGSAVRGAPLSPQQRADALPACEPDGTGTSWGMYIDDALYCTVSRDYAHPWGVCEGYSRGMFNPRVHGCRTVALEGVNGQPDSVVIRRNIACVSNCVTGAL